MNDCKKVLFAKHTDVFVRTTELYGVMLSAFIVLLLKTSELSRAIGIDDASHKVMVAVPFTTLLIIATVDARS